MSNTLPTTVLGNPVQSSSFGPTKPPYGGNPASAQVMRGVGRMADTSTVILSHWENNRSSETYGDHTNVQKIAFSLSTDGFATGTPIASISTGVNDDSIAIYSFVVDDSNNIHVVYVNGDFNAAGRNVLYNKFTYVSGTTWTAGTPKTVFTYASGFGPMGVDIDLMGTGSTACPVIAVFDMTTTLLNSTLYMIPTNGTGSVIQVDTFSAAGAYLNGGAYINNGSVAGLHEAFEDSTTNGTVAFLCVRQFNSSANTNRLAYKVYKINKTTGAIAASNDQFTRSGAPFVVDTGFNENWQLFTSHTREFTIVGTNTTIGNFVATNTVGSVRLSLPAAGAGIATIGEYAASIHYTPQFSSTISAPVWMFCYAMVDDNTFAVFYSDDNGTNSGGTVWVGVVKWTQNPSTHAWTATISPRWFVADGAMDQQNINIGYSPIGTTFAHRTLLYSGINNHQPKNGTWDLGLWYYNYGGGVWAKYYTRTAQLGAPTITTPANASSIQSATPSVAATVAHITQLGPFWSNPYWSSPLRQSRSKIKYQFALDNGFTTGLVTYIMDDTGLQRVDWNMNGGNFAGTTFSNDSTSIPGTVSTTSRIPQATTIYARAAEMDEFGSVSAWSSVISFANSHIPSASGVSPGGGSISSYGSGSVTFSWYFSDPWAGDNQTAYQIQVVDTTTGTTFLDTGKVTAAGSPGAFTTLMSATLSIGGTFANKPLTWRVRVWDSDNVVGSYSGTQAFELTVPPTVAITAPTNATTLTTATPTITWTPTYAGTATGAAYRIVVSQSGSVVFDTGYILGALTSYKIPLGVLLNAQSYTFYVYVQDTLGLTSAPAQSSVLVSLTIPAAPTTIFAYTYDYEVLGFVWIGWDNSTQDAAWFYWNVYRREQGTVSWDYLGSVSATAAQYGYADYTAHSNVTYQYCVTQVAYNTGALVESLFTAIATVNVTGNYYWLIDSEGILPAVPLFQTSKDTFNDEYERNTYNVIDRGRHTDIGEYLGVNGSLTCQLRDRVLSGVTVKNCFADPSMQYLLPYSPYWTISSSNHLNFSVVDPLEPAPSGHTQVLKCDIDSGSVTMAQTLPTNPSVNAGDALNLSTYIYNVAPSETFTVTAQVVYKNSAGTTLTTHSLTLAQVENWQGNSHWFRYAVLETVPAGAIATITVTYSVNSSPTGPLSFLWTGHQITKGASPFPYGDGDTQAWSWDGARYASSSTSTGYYTARQQRLDIKEMCALDRPLYLRTPFGDLFQVSPGDVGFDRLAGVGPSAEFGDLTFPYLEVGL